MSAAAIRRRLRRLEQAMQKKQAERTLSFWDVLTAAVSADNPEPADWNKLGPLFEESAHPSGKPDPIEEAISALPPPSVLSTLTRPNDP
jgi:hypothetical protein